MAVSTFWLLVVTVLALTISVHGIGRYESPATIAGKTFIVVPMSEPDRSFATFKGRTGRVCEYVHETPDVDLTDCWVVSWYSYKLYKIQRPAFFHMLKDKGAHGFIFRSALPDNAVPGGVDKFGNTINADEYPRGFISLVVSRIDGDMLYEVARTYSNNATLYIDDSDRDPFWSNQYGVLLGLFQVSLGTLALCSIGIAAYKLWRFIKFAPKEHRLSIATVCLSLSIFANIVRLIWILFDPMWSLNFAPQQLTQITATLHTPCMLTSSLLICLYWFELLNKTKTASLISKVSFLSRMKIPFGVLVAFLFCFDLGISIPRGFPEVDVNLGVALTIITYVLVNAALSIFFFWNGYRIVQYFKSSPSHTGRSNRLLRATWLIIFSGVANLFLIIGEVLSLTGGVWSPAGWAVAWWTTFASCETSTLLQIMSFKTPRQDTASSLRSRRGAASRVSTTGDDGKNQIIMSAPTTASTASKLQSTVKQGSSDPSSSSMSYSSSSSSSSSSASSGSPIVLPPEEKDKDKKSGVTATNSAATSKAASKSERTSEPVSGSASVSA